jgi:hypothetical protein
VLLRDSGQGVPRGHSKGMMRKQWAWSQPFKTESLGVLRLVSSEPYNFGAFGSGLFISLSYGQLITQLSGVDG